MNDEERWERDLRYYRVARHLIITHGTDGPPPGTKNRRHLVEELHQREHDEDLCGHGVNDGLE